MSVENIHGSTSLVAILEDGKKRVTKTVNRLEANLKVSRTQLKAINDLLTTGTAPPRPTSAKK